MRIRGHNTGFMMEAIAGVDIALWDVFGKSVGMPVHKLMGGGYHSRVRVYQSHLPVLPPDEMAELASKAVAHGFTAIKVTGGAGIATDIRNMTAIREAVGPDIDLMLDAGGVYDLASAIRIGRGLEKLNCLFFEDPLPPEDLSGYIALCAALDISVAMGETEGNRYQFRERLAHQAVDIVLPDISRAGGLSECHKIAILADMYNVKLCPHVSAGSAIYSAASLHLAAAIPNLLMYEYWTGYNPLGNNLLKAPLRYDAGYLEVPQGPGLGIDIDEEKLEQYAVRE
jgi:L-alanine-DL-glutamate epimerase-like enolase superfamily enzyme